MNRRAEIDAERSATAPASTAPVLEVEGIGKAFPGVRALHDVSLTLRPGRVMALVGENGAGKSTLVKLLSGIYQPDGGSIRLFGKPVTLPSAAASARMGISVIHQETVLFNELTVAENIFAGHYPMTRFGQIDWPEMRRRSTEILAQLDAKIGPNVVLKDLSIASRHIVAMARALVGDSPIMIMDEPTAAMSHREIEDLYQIVERLRAEGRAILFISHKFDEIFRIADDYTVLRDGELVGTGAIEDTSRDALVTMMVGREISQVFPKSEVEIGDVVLDARHLSHPTEFDDISFQVRQGEILGVYGLIGAGRTEVMQAIAGVGQRYDGEVLRDGERLPKGRADKAIGKGIVYVPEERGLHGAVLQLPIYQNKTLPNLGAYTRRGFLDLAREVEHSREYARLLDLRAAHLSQEVGTLSGGNQQKVVIGKWMMTSPRVLILDEPTKGIDIGSKAQVHRLVSRMAQDGLAIVLVSSEIPEVLGISDRILVMRAGRVVAELDRQDADAETLVRHAIGVD